MHRLEEYSINQEKLLYQISIHVNFLSSLIQKKLICLVPTDCIKISSKPLENVVVGCLYFWAMTESTMRRTKEGFCSTTVHKWRAYNPVRGLIEGQVLGEAKASPVACQGSSEMEEDQIFLSRFGVNRRASQPAGQTLSAGSLSSRNRFLAVASP